MRAKLVATGEGLAVVIDPSLIDQLGYVVGMEVEVRAEGNSLIIEPMRSRKERIQEAMDRAMAEHHESLRKLGD